MMPALELLCESAEASVRSQNWYSALMMALTLPDICASLGSENGKSSRTLYAEWFDENVGDHYKIRIGRDEELFTFLGGDDCYALRCAFLHHGMSDITDQRAQRALTNFKFVVPPKGLQIHCNLWDEVLQLQVDLFVNDIINSVRSWREKVRGQETVEMRLNNMAEISIMLPGQGFSFGPRE